MRKLRGRRTAGTAVSLMHSECAVIDRWVLEGSPFVGRGVKLVAGLVDWAWRLAAHAMNLHGSTKNENLSELINLLPVSQ